MLPIVHLTPVQGVGHSRSRTTLRSRPDASDMRRSDARLFATPGHLKLIGAAAYS